jgi:hemoglobin
MLMNQATFYERLGGQEGVRALVDRFYDLMDTLPEAADIRRLHPDDLSGSREKLYLFLCGWTGGPPLYVQRYGHPRLRARHLPFPIGERERDQWMLCMDRAMRDRGLPDDLREALHQAFFGTADFMRNQPPEGEQIGPGGRLRVRIRGA